MLDTIESYSDRLESLVDNLLDMSRISSGSAAPLTAPVTWRDAIEDALRGVPGGAIRVDLAPNMPLSTPTLACWSGSSPTSSKTP